MPNRATRRHETVPETFTIQLPPAAHALLKETDAKVGEALAERSKIIATLLSMLDVPGLPTGVDIDTGVVTLTRVPILTEVPPEPDEE